MMAVNRVGKEFVAWDQSIAKCILPDENNMKLWNITFQCSEDSIFKNEEHQLQIQFPDSYPINPPKIIFLTPIEHQHVYSNGVICLSTLYQTQDAYGWSPVLTIEKVFLMIVSMINSAQKRGRPFDDQEYVIQCAHGIVTPETTKFHFEDSTC